MNRTWGIAGILVAAAAAGCNVDPNQGYTTASQYRTDVRTVAVPIFGRGAGEYRRDIEIRLTEAVIKQIEAGTPYKVVDRSRADTLLTGTLRWAKMQPLSFDPRTGEAREIQVRLSVDFTWKSLRGAGETLTERQDFRVAADFIPPCPFSEDFFLGSEDAVNRLARRIVEQLARPW